MGRGGNKGAKGSGDVVLPEKIDSRNGGGISFFQLLIFFIATTSLAINIGLIYGAIPIQGKSIIYNFLKLSPLNFY